MNNPHTVRRPTTLKDIAKSLDLDVSTISKVLSGRGISVRSETKERILEEAKRFNYRPSSVARNLRTNLTGALGILLPNMSNPVYASIVRGAVKRASEIGYVMLVADVDDETDSTSAYLKLVGERRIDGIIIAVSASSKEIISAIQDNPIPHIFVNRRASIGKSVTVNDFAAGFLAARTLIEAGHKYLAFLGASDDLDTAQRRREGFAKACKEEGLPAFYDAVGPYTKQGGYESFTEILELKNRPTGVFASNLLAGIGALAAAWQKDVKIPDDISVISLETEDAMYTTPPLTTIQTSLEEMGARSVDEVEAIFRGREPVNVVVDEQPKLVIRQSLGPPPLRK